MIKRLNFALGYALRNILRDRQRTAFALFSIAAGVATVVALRMLGLMLTDALTSNAQGLMRGDITVETINNSPRISLLQTDSRPIPFTTANIPQFDQWAKAHGVDITYAMTTEVMQSAVVRDNLAGSPAFVISTFIDPKVYPFYNHVRAEDPAGKPLSDLLTGPNQVVVGRRLANQLGIHVGDKLRIGSAPELQTVQGIVPDASESNFNSFLNILFSFVYIDRSYTQNFGLPAGAADTAYIRIPANQSADQVANTIRTEWPRPPSSRWRIDNVVRVLKNNTFIADLISRFVLLLSLVALVIGGVGIVNVMLVSVNRRSTEIAVLKTVGVQGSGVGLLFFAEALILGIVGSLIGLGLGLVLSLIAQSVGEQAFAVTLPWHFSVDPLLLGLTLGIIMTLLFSILPTLMASRVRPGLVLRQGNIPLARAGCLPSLISLVILLAGVSAISETIIGDVRNKLPPRLAGLPYGLLGTLAVFILIVIVFVLVWLMVWLLGHLPSFRNPNVRIAIRGLTQHRGRTALSLGALIIGMTALSGTLIMTRSINILLQTSISDLVGGNVIILPILPLSDTAAHVRLSTLSGVSGYRDVRFAPSELVAVNGDRNFESKVFIEDDITSQIAREQLNVVLGMDVHGSPPRETLLDGRFLDDSDAGKFHIVLPETTQLDELGVYVGSTLTYRIGSAEYTFTVVGLVNPDARAGLIPLSLGDGAIQVPLNVVSRSVPFDPIIANVAPQSVNDVMASVGAIPGVLVVDLDFFDSIITRLLSQAAALPLLVAGFSLFAAAVLIATTVSLATLERRRQIAVLKALGVTRRQALNQILIENAIVGLAGGVISLVPTLLVLILVPILTQNLVQLPVPVDLIVLMLVLSVLITMIATLLTAWSASSEKPLAALRYE